MAYDELYEDCYKSVVELYHRSGGRACCMDNGVILFHDHETGFAYIVGRKTCAHGSTELEISFGRHDETVPVTPDMIKSIGPFIGVSCLVPASIDATSIKAVEIYQEKLLSSESVFTLTFKYFEEAPDLTPGFVRAASIDTMNGSLVVKEDGRFVGLCYGEKCRMLAASSVRSLARNISQSYGTDNSMGINELLQHVYDSAMQCNDEN